LASVNVWSKAAAPLGAAVDFWQAFLMPAPSRDPRLALPAVLVLEDDEPCRILVADVLTLAGFEVCTAPDGRRVAAILRERPIDLVITDLAMPGRDGLATLTALRQSHPGLPVIAMSGGLRVNPQLYRAVAEKLGAGRVFAKPFKMDELIAAAREALAASHVPTACPEHAEAAPLVAVG
jgi:DNA-binding response OmpR family regulator